MNKLFPAVAVALLTVTVMSARLLGQDALPSWAFAQAPPGTQRPPDTGKVFQLEGSTAGYTSTQINDLFSAVDWYPREHPPIPDPVARGRRPDVRACGVCHLAPGYGHPESAALAGLNADYIVAQMHAYRDGRRKSSGGNMIMNQIAKGATDEEIRRAAEYFASVKPKSMVRIVETDMAPVTFVGPANMRFVTTDGKKESIGRRILEVPEDAERAELRDPHSEFVAYVPKGSIAAGKQLAETGGDRVAGGRIVKGKTVACGVCHGADLRGLGAVPALAGRSPIFLTRQLWDFQHGARTGNEAALMMPVVRDLTQDDMLNLSAYIASLQP